MQLVFRYWKCCIKGASAGKLQGLKVAIKDNICVAGVPMMNGSRILEGYTPEFDATVVARVLDAGAKIIGKTTCEDLCCSGASYNTTYGPVRNPWNKEHSAGGSSSGSAVAVSFLQRNLQFGIWRGVSLFRTEQSMLHMRFTSSMGNNLAWKNEFRLLQAWLNWL